MLWRHFFQNYGCWSSCSVSQVIPVGRCHRFEFNWAWWSKCFSLCFIAPVKCQLFILSCCAPTPPSPHNGHARWLGKSHARSVVSWIVLDSKPICGSMKYLISKQREKPTFAESLGKAKPKKKKEIGEDKTWRLARYSYLLQFVKVWPYNSTVR